MIDKSTYEFIDMPVGPQPIPEWVRDMAVDWVDQYSNPPRLAIKERGNAHEWPDKVWTRPRAGCFAALSGDGRADFLQHGGSIFEEDGELVTARQEGFAGRSFKVLMGPGDAFANRWISLRGPWFGWHLTGYQQVTTVDEKLASDLFWTKRGHPWWARGGCFGLWLSEDLIIRLLARYQPHLRVARVREHIGGKIFESIQPLKPEWDEPKAWIMERERQRYLAARAERA